MRKISIVFEYVLTTANLSGYFMIIREDFS